MLAELPAYVDAEFVRAATGAIVVGAFALGLVTLIWVRALGTRLVVIALLGIAVLAGLRYREQIEACAKTCDCAMFGEDLRVEGCTFSATG